MSQINIHKFSNYLSQGDIPITNNTSTELDLISWIDEDGKTVWFGTDRVWDYVLYQYLDGLKVGGSDEQDVEPGDSPIYFWFAAGGPECRTVDYIVAEEYKKESFTLTDSTLIYVGSGMSTKMPFNKAATRTHIMTTDNNNDRYEAYMKMK